MQTYSNLLDVETVSDRKQEQGFSLIELLVAMVVFLIVTGAIYGVLEIAQRSRKVTNERTHLNKNARVALNTLGRDTFNAGYSYPSSTAVLLPDNRISTLLGIPNDFDTTRDLVPPVIAGNNVRLITSSNLNSDQVTFAFRDSAFNLDANGTSQPLGINAPTTVSGVDQIVPLSGSNSQCKKNDIYVITGGLGSALAVATGLSGSSAVQFANGDVLGFNQAGTLPTITLPASMRKVILITYFVSADGVLTRRVYANSADATTASPWRDEPLVYGVEDFQITYIMDDGAVSNNPSAGLDGIPGNADDEQASLKKVRQVRYTINIKSEQLDQAGQPYRISMTSTFSTRNLGYSAG
jgi:prepilin-type N-terminal cleavage/methylation domain-containing protein